MLLKDAIHIPTQLGSEQFVLRLTEGVSDAQAQKTLDDYVITPAIAKNLDLNHALLVALLLLALSPVPPVLPTKQIKAGGSTSFVLGLLVIAALAAIVVAPAGVELIGRLFGRRLDVPYWAVIRPVAISVLLPVVLGIVVARAAPAFAARAVGPVSKAAGILLLVSFLPVLWVAWGAISAQMTNYTVVAIVAFVAIGLLAGHVLGGPEPGDRTALALATATRHPGVAIAVVHAIEPGNKDIALVIVLYLLVSAVASLPYVRSRSRAQAAGAGR